MFWGYNVEIYNSRVETGIISTHSEKFAEAAEELEDCYGDELVEIQKLRPIAPGTIINYGITEETIKEIEREAIW